MENIKRGQKVWVSIPMYGEVKETTIKSVGNKYITLECNLRKKFHRDTLKEVDARGIADFIILDLKKHEEDKRYSSMIRRFKKFDWSILDREDLQKVEDILRDY